ncbi:MAG: extracellular solute-binding protein [Chthonomonadales bacterium]|nr:extracellular solute-binding protein [Chthonomonadales bacterium]
MTRSPDAGRQTRSRRRAFAFLIACLAALAAFGCARPREPARVRLVVWGLQYGEESEGLRARVSEFERRHPGIEVSILSMGAGQMNPQKLMTAIVGNVPPDVIHQDRFTIGDWASRDAFRPLDDLIRDDVGAPDAIRRTDFYPACWAEAVYEGKVYAVPSGTDDRALYYNRAAFREVGLDPDRPPRSWADLKDCAVKLTRLAPDGSFERIGFIPNYGNSWLYLYSWQNGGEMMSPDGRRCTMDNPGTVGALRFMVDIYDALGGVTKVDAFSSGFQTQELDPFLTGKVAMKIDGNWVLQGIARYRPDLDFAVAPAPVPRERLEQTLGGKPGRFHGEDPFITWAGGFSYAIPRGAPHPREAWQFVKWMSSVEANLIDARAQQAYNVGKGRPFVPPISANKRVNEAVFREFAPRSAKLRQPLRLFIDMMDAARFRPVTFVGQRLWDEHVRAFEQATHHAETGKTPKEALADGRRVVQAELDKAIAYARYPLLDQRVPIAISAVFGLALLAFAGVRLRGVLRMGRVSRGEALAGLLFAMPWILGFLVLTAGPIITSIFLSFCSYDVLHPPRYVGLHNYAELFGADMYYLRTSLYNVAYLATIGIPLGIVTGLAIAMLLNAKIGGMSGYRTAFYLPSIVPVVASAVLWAWVLNGDPSRGLLNAAWKATLTAWFGVDPPGWFGAAEWAKPGLIIQGLWGAGGGMILWLAGLQGIPQHLYEAADLDGAGWWSRFRNVTVPMLSPYIFFNLIMGTIAALQEFDRIYVLSGQGAGSTSVGPVDSLLVPVMYLFNNAFKYFKMGYASALAWVLFIIILVLTVIQLKLAPRWVHYEAEKR